MNRLGDFLKFLASVKLGTGLPTNFVENKGFRQKW